LQSTRPHDHVDVRASIRLDAVIGGHSRSELARILRFYEVTMVRAMRAVGYTEGRIGRSRENFYAVHDF
jgi:hypothetical protein